MSSSTYSDVEKYQLAPLRETIYELETQRTVLEKNLLRLCGEAFENKEQSFLRLGEMVQDKGAAKVCEILDNKGWNSRASIGFLRGGVLSPDKTRQANDALASIKTQVGAYEKLANDLKDKRAALQAISETVSSPTSSPIPLPGYTVWGGRPGPNEEEAWYHKPVNPAGEGGTSPQPTASDQSWFRKKPKPEDDDATAISGERENPSGRPR